jgi:hypothetical protein
MSTLARSFALGALILTAASINAWAAEGAGPHPDAKTADEVVARNVAARGGLAAWRKVNTMGWFGHVEHGSVTKDAPQVPFVMQLERPNKTRFELKEQMSNFTRVFDGQRGWRIRPGGDGRPETRMFSPDEVKFARSEYVIDGPLIDCKEKGVLVDLDGIDMMEGRRAYRLSVRLPAGAERKIWVDAQTNLELRLDRPSQSPFSPGKPVSVYFYDWAREGGVNLPHRIETTGLGASAASGAAERLVINHVLVNPKLEEMAFVPPERPLRHGGSGLVRIPGSMPGDLDPQH